MTQNPASSAFQTYPTVLDILASPIPEHMTLEQAVVLPLAVSTACSGLYPKNLLNFPLPSAIKVEKSGKMILIWGGASSVGATAIQLAVASGVTVVTTASFANHELVKSLGAEHVFDYKSPTVIWDIVKILERTEFVGLYEAISEDASFDMDSKFSKSCRRRFQLPVFCRTARAPICSIRLIVSG